MLNHGVSELGGELLEVVRVCRQRNMLIDQRQEAHRDELISLATASLCVT